MKTPREVLFRRHDAADPKLDALRRKVVAQLPPTPAARHEPFPFSIALTVWRELILPAQRLWAGLAAAWIILLIANANLFDDQPGTATAKHSGPADLQKKYQEEKQLLAELSGALEPRTVAPPLPFAPRPRSDVRNRWETV